jgi:chaperonin cofactor prefoldin
VQVTLEDQQKINEFGRLTTTYRELRAEVGGRKQRVADIESSETDLFQAFDAESALVQVGEVFVKLSVDDAIARLGEMKESASKEVDNAQRRRIAVRDRLNELKKALYSRLGEAVFLEFSDDEE